MYKTNSIKVLKTVWQEKDYVYRKNGWTCVSAKWMQTSCFSQRVLRMYVLSNLEKWGKKISKKSKVDFNTT